jgi:proteasome lid subunit RPN8/RPN11
MVARLSDVQRFIISSSVVHETLQSLRRFGARRLECLVLWLGKVDGERASVVRALTPEQESISSEDGVGYFVSGQTLFLLNRALSETGLRLVAQVHSHPTEAYHSSTDDRYAIVTADGGLSLVVPDFGNAPPDPVCWAVYRLAQGQWIELQHADAKELLVVVEEP